MGDLHNDPAVRPHDPEESEARRKLLIQVSNHNGKSLKSKTGQQPPKKTS